MKKLFKNILFDTFLYIIILLILIFILDKLGYVLLNWIMYLSMVIIDIGIVIGTTQIITKNIKKIKTKIILCIVVTIFELVIIIPTNYLYILFNDQEEFVHKNNQLMIKETHSFLLSDWVCYYDFENIFVRKKQERIYEAETHDDSTSGYSYTIYYDKQGKPIRKDIKPKT